MTKRETLVWDKATQKMVPLNKKKVDVDAPFVQMDEIPPTMSHATSEGLVFTSRSKLLQHYKENGFECTGGSHLTGEGIGPKRKERLDPREIARRAEWGMLRVDPEIRAEVMKAKQRLEWGMAPLSEREKSLCQEEERQYKMYAKNHCR